MIEISSFMKLDDLLNMINKVLDERTIQFYRYFFLLLVTLSLSSIVFALSPFNKTSLSILGNPDIKVLSGGPTRPEVKLTNNTQDITLDCDFRKLDASSICGIVFQFPLNIDTNQFISFNNIDYFELESNVISSNEHFNHRVRMFIKSLFNQSAWKHYQDSDVKYHAVRFNAQELSTIPLERFDVETWWEEMYSIPYFDAQKDYSKIVGVELFINDMPIQITGEYQITLTKLVAIGSYIQLKKLYTLLVYLWPFSIAIFLFHYTLIRNQQLKALRAVTYFADSTSILNPQGFVERYSEYKGQSGVYYLVKLQNWASLAKHFGVDIANEVVQASHKNLVVLLKESHYLLARMSSDEVVLLVIDERLDPNTEFKLFNSFLDGIEINGLGHLRLEIKVGIVEDNDLGINPASAIADARMAVKSILNTHQLCQLFNDEISEVARNEAFIESQIRKALDDDSFYLVFMPLYNSTTNRICGAEALLRCSLPTLATMSPEVYIPIAERAGLIRKIDFWVIEAALTTLASEGQVADNFILSINLSSRELLDVSFAQHFKTLLKKSGVRAERICLEVTETFFVDIEQISAEAIGQLRALGCHFSLDDFGTGYTSFTHLVNLPVDEIKIDRSFVSNLADEKLAVIVASIIDIAHVYGYDIVAEGVEEASQLAFLKSKGCFRHQDYFISKPVSFARVLEIDDELQSGVRTF
jgi:EAL domain-containing protein (putative c-di-GMP-specific phosphodiesterase class I)